MFNQQYAKMLEGKVAVVTGASQGIGLACATAMLEAGATIVPVGRNLKKLEDVYFAHRSTVIPMAADLTNAKERAELIQRILDKTGKVDIFCANAGEYVAGHEVEASKIESVMGLNVQGVIVPAIAVKDHMIKQGTGDIVVIGSIAGEHYLPYHEVIYGPSKAAPERFAKLLRRELSAYDIRVGTISPGPTDTPLVEGWNPERLARARAAKELMSPTEVSNALMYMLSRPRDVAVANMTVTPRAFNML